MVTIGNVDLVFTGGILVRRAEAATRTGGLEVRDVDFSINGKNLLEKVSLTARPGTLTAIIGGSGAGKTTLSRLIAGYTTPTSGSVTFEGHDIHTEYASLRTRIGMVPQDDVVHRQLTVNQALGYAAELRLPPDTSKADRDQVVAQVLDELGLTQHADTRVDKLSGGQRKRASVALELLTGPSLLILDEPTSGLDPALDLQVMTMLRQLADAGRVVLVVTHSLTYLDVCDQVLLMAPGGKTAFLGAPGQIGEAMGTTNWAQIFAKVGADPDEANRRFLAREPAAAAPAESARPIWAPRRTPACAASSPRSRAARSGWSSPTAPTSSFLAVLPFIMGALSLTVPGNTGFGVADPTSATPDEAAQILTLLSIAAVFMGTALTIRDLIGERAIFRREQAVGLSTGAYLSAKITVFCAFAIIQAAIATVIVILGKGAPTDSRRCCSVIRAFELFVTVAATCVASAILGLVLSSLARSNEQIMPLLVVSLMLQLVLAGGLIPVTGRIFLDQLSWLVPSRWGYAASASTVNLRALVPGSLVPKDSHWLHTRSAWLLDMGMLCRAVGDLLRHRAVAHPAQALSHASRPRPSAARAPARKPSPCGTSTRAPASEAVLHNAGSHSLNTTRSVRNRLRSSSLKSRKSLPANSQSVQLSTGRQAVHRVFAHRDQRVGRRPAIPGIDADHGNVRGQRQRLTHLSTGYLGAPSNSLTATRNGSLRCSKKSTAAKLSCRRRQSTRTIAPIAPRTRSSHMNQNRRWPGVPNR